MTPSPKPCSRCGQSHGDDTENRYVERLVADGAKHCCAVNHCDEWMCYCGPADECGSGQSGATPATPAPLDLDAVERSMTDGIRALDGLVPASEDATRAVIALADGKRALITEVRRLREALGRLVDAIERSGHNERRTVGERWVMDVAGPPSKWPVVKDARSLLSVKGGATPEKGPPCNEHIEGCVLRGTHRTHRDHAANVIPPAPENTPQATELLERDRRIRIERGDYSPENIALGRALIEAENAPQEETR